MLFRQDPCNNGALALKGYPVYIFVNYYYHYYYYYYYLLLFTQQRFLIRQLGHKHCFSAVLTLVV